MVEVKITYETLFDFLRREKNRSELQQLERTFYRDVVEYLKEKKSTLRDEDSHTLLFSRGEQEKIKIQIKNIQKIVRELYELREKKVITLATNKVRTDSNLIDTSNLLPEELSLFNDACALLSKYKEGVLNRVLISEMPFESLKSNAIDNYSPSQNTSESKKDFERIEKEEPQSEKTKENIFDEYKKKLDEAREKSERKAELANTYSSQNSESMKKVKVLNDLPKFMGQDKNIYGPYKQGDLAELPESVSNILLKKGRIELAE